MTLPEFQRQINRLIEQFGKASYSQARAELIWREVKDLPERWFVQTIDKFVGECRHPPLMPEFREEIARERERLWKLEKEQNEKDAKDFFEGTYDAEDTRTICDTIRKRLAGGVPDQDYAKFIELLNQAAQQKGE